MYILKLIRNELLGSLSYIFFYVVLWFMYILIFSIYDINLLLLLKLFDVVYGYVYELYREYVYLRIEERGDVIKKN